MSCWRQCCNNCYLDIVISRTGKLPLPLKLAQMPGESRRPPVPASLFGCLAVCCRFGTPISGIESNYLVILTLRLFAVCRKTLCALRLVTIQVALQLACRCPLPPTCLEVDLATLDSHYTDLPWCCTFNTCFAMPRGEQQRQREREWESERGEALEEI